MNGNSSEKLIVGIFSAVSDHTNKESVQRTKEIGKYLNASGIERRLIALNMLATPQM